MAETTYILTQETAEVQGINNYSTEDTALVDQYIINSEFNSETDIIELYVYAEDGTLLQVISNYTGYKELQNSASAGKDGASVLYIDPVQDSQTLGYTQGGVRLVYNFLRNVSDVTPYISEISTDRTELKAKTLEETPALLSAVRDLQNRLNTVPYFNEFRLNFLNGTLLIGVNVAIDADGSILLKLYEPLPGNIAPKTSFRLVENVSDTLSYTIDAETTPDVVNYNTLRGPNFNVEIQEQSVQPTGFLTYNDLYLYPVTSSYYQLLNQVSQSGAQISIDYSDYTNFVHFSSAQERLDNFVYKLGLVQTYESASSAISSQLTVSASLATSQSLTYYQNLIEGIVGKFDGYESYLYFQSSSYAWPKTNTVKPYLNAATGSAAAISWYASQSLSASLYDELNQSSLVYTIPEFIRQDSLNAPYSLFVNMVGQHFDTLWVYAKAVTDKYSADNRLDYGISKDLVGEALRSFGVKLYSSNFSVANLNSLFLGEFYNTGSEQISSFVTASNQPTPDKDILAETYKRIYHNLSYLMKTKGTERGVRALVNCFGIPSGSLSIRTYGGINTAQSNPYFGTAVTSSLKIRTDNTGSIVSGNTLSQYASIQKDDKKYTQDTHAVEVAFSPTYNLDNYIKSKITASFDIDDYIGDPRYIYSSSYNNTEANLYRVAETILSGSSAYDVFDFVRLIKFFDNQLFKMVKDFLPARDTVTSGIVIKPHLLNRSKIKQAQPTGTRPEYSGSIDTLTVVGSDGGVIDGYSTAHTASVLTPQGEVTVIRNTEVEKINGELGGSVIDLYTGTLNAANTLKDFDVPELVYDTTGSNGNSPAAGAIFWRSISLTNSTGAITGYGVGSIHINEISKNGVNTRTALSNLSPGDSITFTITYDGIEGGSPCGIPATTILTQIIESITFRGNSIWQIQFRRSSIKVLFQANTGFCDQGITYYNYADSTVLISPYIDLNNFYNSDYNALINNATAIANSSNVQKVDYSITPLVPVNIEALRSGSAQRAEVQEYLYNSAGMVRGRYTGKQLRGQEINFWQSGDISYGRTPVVESKTPYFCIFDYISGFSPEHNQANAIVISYIVDELGNLITPDSPEALPILKQSFPQESKAEITIQSPSIGGSEATLLGEQVILKGGARLEPIVYSYTAATYLFPSYSKDSRLEFDVDDTLPTYDMVAQGSGTQSPTTTVNAITTITFSNESRDDQSYYNTGTSRYTFAADTEQPVKFTATIETQGSGIVGDSYIEPAAVQYRIERSTDGTFNLGTVSTLASKTVIYDAASLEEVKLTTGYVNYDSGSSIRVIVTPLDTYLDSLLLTSRVFQAASFESGSSYIAQSDNTQNYFFVTASAATNTVLTASLSLSSKYDNLFIGISGSSTQGFNTVTLPFTVQVGDEIKFNNDEAKVFLVTNVETPAQNAQQVLYITLDKKPNKAVNKDFFVIRRYIDTSNMVLMRINRVAGTQNAGVLFPKYPSDILKANYTRILSDLVNKGIL